MSNQFTPGPWTTGKNGDNCAEGHAICSGPRVIAKVYGTGYPIGKGASPQSSADARLIAAAPTLLKALSQMNHMGGDERGGYCICPKQDGSAPDDQHASSCADARSALRLAGIDIEPRPSVHVKLRPKGKKRFGFLSGNGGLNHLRIHAAMFTPERARQVVAEIKAEHGDKYETRIEAF